ncbi:MAG TPA: M23 family metallopeptidase [Nannocystis sp.]
MKLRDERRFGLGASLRLAGSSVLMFFNPWTASQIVGQALGQLIAALRARGRPPPAIARIHLPVRGKWRVYRGGNTRETSHSWSLLSQRYAYDLVSVDTSGRRFRPPGRHARDFFTMGMPVHSPVAGRVCAVRDDCRDFPHAGLGWTDWRTRDLRGNHVLIEADSGLYVLLAHLSRGSVAVAPGERVVVGQVLGRAGNSGNTTEPHVHIHVQDRASFSTAVGVPLVFEGARIERPSDDDGPSWPKEDDFVEWDESAKPASDFAVPKVSSADVMHAALTCVGNIVAVFVLWRALFRGLLWLFHRSA